MHTGSWLMAGESDIKVFSPWFGRGGDNGIFLYERIAVIGSPTFTVRVAHKSLEEVGNGSLVTGNFAIVGSSAFYKLQVSNLKELHRFQYTISASGSGQTEMVLYRMLATTWFNDA